MERRSTSCWLASWLERQLKRWNSFFSSSLRSSRFYCHTSFLIIRFQLIFRERVRVCGCPCSRNRELTLQIIFCECVCLPSEWMEKKQQYAVQVEFLRGECLPIQKSSWICIFSGIARCMSNKIQFVVQFRLNGTMKLKATNCRCADIAFSRRKKIG